MKCRFMFTRRAVAIAGIAMALLASPIGAADLNIGVVNIARLLEEAPQVRSAMQSLQEEFAPRRRDLVEQTSALQSREEALQRDLATMSDDARRGAERELREKQRDLARRQNEFLEDLNLRRNEELGNVQRALIQEVQSFARSGKFDLILGDGVLFANDAVDITAQVLARLESSFKNGN